MKGIDPVEQEVLEKDLPEGMVEERVQVDRRRLEKMILQEENFDDQDLPKAEEFFLHVEKESGATVSWPTRLKIGAKTKKDPYVKVIGYPTHVQTAKEMICSLLKVKRDRVTLKMEISHNSHSHIIGRDENCHIARNWTETSAKDSNKHNDVEKNNQVSIAGTIDQVEKARAQLRLISPVSISFTILIGNHAPVNIQEVQRLLSIPEININQHTTSKSTVHFSIKSSVQHESKIVEAIVRIHEIYGLNSFAELVCYSSFDLRPALLQSTYGLFHHNTISMIAIQTNTVMQFSPQEPCIIISGAPQHIFLTRKYLTGLLPISIQFERPSLLEVSPSIRSTLEKECEVFILEKKRNNNNCNDSMIVIRSYEANVLQIYTATHKLVDPNSKVDIAEDLSFMFMKDLIQMTKVLTLSNQSILPNGLHLQPLQPSRDSNLFQKTKERTLAIDNIKSPDPTESPIAHSLLSTAKSHEKNLINRNQLLLLANRATYVSEVKANIRQPTSLWAGYGFSNSLPADILKLGLRENATPSNNQSNYLANVVDEKMNKSNNQKETQRFEGRPIVGRGAHDIENERISPMMSSISKGLASVREEEELSDYNQSYSSIFEDPSTNASNGVPFPLPKIFKKPTFAASTGVFESTPPISNEFIWDIKTFGDPALVLAQLGCSEYLPQFRDQEIDLQAFLLLDEQNLKDIGVSTMGARKKIFNAILKLRDSAVKYGYAL